MNAKDSLEVVILAAGKGTRMMSDLPKVLHPLGGKPLLSHVIRQAQSVDANGIHIVYGNQAERVRSDIESELALEHESLNWVLQTKQLGTGHAVLQALNTLSQADGRVLVLYGDVPMLSAETLNAFLSYANSHPLAVLVAELEDPTGFGRIIRDSSGRLVRIQEQRDATLAEQAIREINTGIMVAKTRHLQRWLNQLKPYNQQGEYYLTDAVLMAVEEGLTVGDYRIKDANETLGVNDLWQLAQLERLYQLKQAKYWALKGVRITDPARFDSRGWDIHIEPGVVIEPNVMLESPVFIGSGSIIGPQVSIKNTVIGRDVRILANTVIEGAMIKDQVSVGPFARLRSGSELHDHAKVGNFVEMKKTVLGRGSKASHLSYLGDAIIEEDVNIGAGTITCNYDGLNKWPTVIKAGAFIGSNTALVAPITIGARAVIGAGSTLTRNAPEEELTLARSPQKTISGWQRKLKHKRNSDAQNT